MFARGHALLVVSVLGSFCIFRAGFASAEAFVVDASGGGDFLSVQAAVDAASPGDSILVQAGLYEESVRVSPEKGDLLIRGEPGPGFVTIHGDSLSLGIWRNQGIVRVEGMTLTGGSLVGTIYTQGARAEFVNCVVKENEGPGGCHGDGGGGTINQSSDVLFQDCVFEQNRNWEAPGGLIIWSSHAEIRGCIFRDNQSCYGGGLEIYHCQTEEPSLIEGNLFLGNQADVHGGGMFNVDSSPLIRNNTFVNNSAGDGGALTVLGGHPQISRNIFVGSPHAVVCLTESGYPLSLPQFGSDLVWDMTGSEIEACAAPDSLLRADPLFCSPETGDYSVCADSPAAAGAYGAFGVGCEACLVPVERTTWGALKARYR